MQLLLIVDVSRFFQHASHTCQNNHKKERISPNQLIDVAIDNECCFMWVVRTTRSKSNRGHRRRTRSRTKYLNKVCTPLPTPSKQGGIITTRFFPTQKWTHPHPPPPAPLPSTPLWKNARLAPQCFVWHKGVYDVKRQIARPLSLSLSPSIACAVRYFVHAFACSSTQIDRQPATQFLKSKEKKNKKREQHKPIQKEE